MPVVFSLPDTVPDRMENESVPPQNYILPVHTPDESPPADNPVTDPAVPEQPLPFLLPYCC